MPKPTPTSFTVTGVIRSAENQKPLAGLRVRVNDCDLRRQQVLHDEVLVTDREGRYTVTFSRVRFLRADKNGPDVQVQVFGPDDEGMTRVLATSDIRFNASERTEIDVAIPAEVYREPEEWAQLTAEAKGINRRGGLKTAEWEENGQHRDLTFIAGETGRDLKIWRAFALAQRLAARTKIPAEAWYGLLRYDRIGTGMPAGARGLAEQTEQVLKNLPALDLELARRTIQLAVQQRSIPEIPEAEADRWIEQWRALALSVLEQEEAAVQEILDEIGLPAAKRKTFWEIFQAHQRRFNGEMIARLREKGRFSAKETEALETAFKVLDLTRQNAALSRHLLQTTGKSAANLRQLAQKGPEEWRAILNAAPSPAKKRSASAGLLPSAPDGEEMARRLAAAYPTPAFAGALERHLNRGTRSTSGPSGIPTLKHTDRILQFLKQHPEFDFLDHEQRLDDFFKNGKSSAAKGSRRAAAQIAEEEFQQELKAVQRVFRLRPDFNATLSLLSGGLHSAQQIAQWSEQAFVEKFGTAPGFSEQDARATWQKATHIHATMVKWLGDVRADQNAQMVKALRLPSAPNVSARGVVPNYETLFGSTDLCMCEHCKSVYSPAAYLADAILFLKNRPPHNGLTPWDVLRKRRPDLGFLDFSCDNTNVPLPYIDLVNEALEEAVAPQATTAQIGPPNPAWDTAQQLDEASLNKFRQLTGAPIARNAKINPIHPESGQSNWVLRDDNHAFLLKWSADNKSVEARLLRQTRGKAEDLEARPQYVNNPAYDRLRQAVYPNSLPFDLTGEELRLYLKKTGSRRWEIMENYRLLKNNYPGTLEDIACEYFGIAVDKGAAMDEKRLILKMADNQAEIWGISAVTAEFQVRSFLDKTGLTYQEMLALLDLEFINPEDNIQIRYAGGPTESNCNTNGQFLTGINAAVLDRIHRFLRLWRKTGLKMWELNMLIMHPKFGNGRLGAQQTGSDYWEHGAGFLAALMQGFEIKEMLGIDVEQLCALFGTIPTRGKFTAAGKARDASLFERLFLNPRRFHPVDPVFVDVMNGGRFPWRDHTPALLAGLRVPAQALYVLAEAAELDTTVEWGLSELSKVYRHYVLAGSLSVPFAEWYHLAKLANPLTVLMTDESNYVPFQPNIVATVFEYPSGALNWLKKLNRLRQTGFSVDDLQFMMFSGEPAADHPASAINTKPWIDTLRQSLSDINAKYQGYLNRLDTTDEQEGSANAAQKLPEPLANLLTETLEWIGWTGNDILTLIAILEKMRQSGGFEALNPAGSGVSPDQRFLLTRLRFFQTPVVRIELASHPNFSLSDFSPVWRGRLSYDAQSRTLQLTGYFLWDDFTELLEKSDDPEWHYTIQALRERLHGSIEGDWLFEPEVRALTGVFTETIRTILNPLFTRQSNQETEAVIVAELSRRIPAKNETQAFALLQNNPGIRGNLTGHFRRLTTLDASHERDALRVFQGLYRMAMLADKWGIDAGTIAIFQRLPHQAGGYLNPLRLVQLIPEGQIIHDERLSNLHRLWQFHRRYSKTGFGIVELLRQLAGPVMPVAHIPRFGQQVNEITGWDENNLEALLGQIAGNNYQFAQMDTWEALERLFSTLNKTNADPGLLWELAQPRVATGNAQQFISLLAARYGEKDQHDLHRDIQNQLRERKRDSLVAYLLNNNNAGWKDAADLFSHFLIDVEMCSCQISSRIVQAHGAVQMFVQRCLLGLEDEVKPERDKQGWEQWKWMKNYRLWEANRKVFLYPENWLEPELRRDKSPFFKDLENALLQSNLDRDSIESAFLHYVEKLDGVANLEPMGHWYEEEKDTLHVFARTSGEAHLYYYRRWMDNAYWTPWEKVDADIKSEYLIPTVRNGQVYLYWPEFREQPEEVTSVPVPNRTQQESGSFEVEPPSKNLIIYMAQSRLINGKWEAKRISENGISLSLPSLLKSAGGNLTNAFFHEIIKNMFIFIVNARSPAPVTMPTPAFSITCFARFQYNWNSKTTLRYTEDYYWSGAFVSEGCGEVLIPCPPDISMEHYGYPPDTSFTRHYFSDVDYFKMSSVENVSRMTGAHTPHVSRDDLTLKLYYQGSNAGLLYEKPILSRTNGIFKIKESWQVGAYDKSWNLFPIDTKTPMLAGGNLPWFLEINSRKFFILPVLPYSNRLLYYKDFIPYHTLLIRALELKAQLDTTLISQEFYNAEVAKLIKSLSEFNAPNASELAWGQLLFVYRFSIFYHPLTCLFAQKINTAGIPVLLSRETQLFYKEGFDFENEYQPVTSIVYAPDGYPKEDIDFTPDGAYSSYNWELFFHAPMLIAQRLTKNQRFEEAMQWYHYMFNPLGIDTVPEGDSLPDSPQKYWITKPFFKRITGDITDADSYAGQHIQNWLARLSDLHPNGAGMQQYQDAVKLWRKNPFDPHLIARFRTVAYQKGMLMKYIDNLVAWGDQLFRQDTMESINEATQLYVIAAEILGPRPRKIPARAVARPLSFHELEPQLDAFSNALVQAENLIPVVQTGSVSQAPAENLPSSLSMLFFCLPHNEKLLEYWDTVADRLYKIRHCQNIEGVERQLALFAPPIDPGAVIGALAGGGSLDSAMAELNAPLPLYRFQVMLQKANELCNDLKTLGGALLSALEKKDGEEMALLRQGQELELLNLIKDIKNKAIEDAESSIDGLKKNKELIQIKETYYKSREFMNAGETVAVSLNTASAILDVSIAVGYTLAGGLSLIPNFVIGASGLGSPVATASTGGESIASAAEHAVKTIAAISRALEKSANITNTISNYQRRKEDWEHQANLATKELEQIEFQLKTAEIKLDIAKIELSNHELQIRNAHVIDEYMHSKYTNQELYEWMSTQISQVYFQTYQMAFDLAKRAERCLQYELGLENTRIIQYGHWDSLKKGLMSAERLQLELRKLEQAYMDRNKREFELTKHISLNLLNPLALLQLRETGKCDFAIPEELFDLDFPGHYFRRIKSVSVSIPCVAGPYTTINATLRLKKSSVRVKTGGSGYARRPEGDDDRFRDYFAGVQSIATSTAQNDSGLFELNFRDERYLPFEGLGVVSEWTLEMMHDEDNPEGAKRLRQFDYDTIADVIVHLRYTAREDGVLKGNAITYLTGLVDEWSSIETPFYRVFSLRHEFPNEYQVWKNGENLKLILRRSQFPYFVQQQPDLAINADGVELVVVGPVQPPPSPGPTPTEPPPNPNQGTVTVVARAGTKITEWEVSFPAVHNPQAVYYVQVQYTFRSPNSNNNSSDGSSSTGNGGSNTGGTGSGNTGGGGGGSNDPQTAGVFAGFKHRVDAGNSNDWKAPFTVLRHPDLDRKPGAMLFVNSNFGIGATGADNPNHFGVRYDGQQWTIRHCNPAALMSTGYVFNVLVAPENCPNAFIHRAEAGNSSINRTYINNALCNGRENVHLLVTQRSEIVNDRAIVAAWDAANGGRWFICNQITPDVDDLDDADRHGIPPGAEFNVLVIDSDHFGNIRTFSHVAAADTIIPAGMGISFIDHALLNGNPDAIFLAMPVWRGVSYNNSATALWYDDPEDAWDYKEGYWSVYNSIPGIPMTVDMAFNIFILAS